MSEYRRRSASVAIAAILIVAAVVGLYKWAASQRGEKPVDIIVTVKATSSAIDFWKVLITGVEDAANEFGANVTVIGPPSETEIDIQMEQLEQAIRQKPDAIVMAATDYNRLVPIAQRIVKAGIKLITVDSRINSDDALSFIATDNMAAGEKAGEEMAKLLPGADSSKIAIMSYVYGTSSQLEREKGVRQWLEGHSNVEVASTLFSEGRLEKAYELTKQLLSEDPGIKGIVGLNEPSTVGAGRAIRDLGLSGKIKLVGFDSSVDEVQLIEGGVLQATVVQKPYNMGYLSVKTAIEAVRGKKVPRLIDTESVVINKDNMYTEQNQKLLFPFVGE
ncbi:MULTISPECIES: substrate-binding domain-containing protein [unclassified Paenibacillus]|uniref:substrate-binding domain-containing protein n=1 Tax=unclassified Paenibacillus TaxID=185978 RepID=UPI00104CA9B5|nr:MULTISPECIES: substrate-binding domain-containing protein [unclassified Paenibacillus]NIK70746.1 ribose transport system substrate-binding protein [Paenibacillus sp. BK720]TCM93282.1 monosaccharide ABC transporter substrate-binding protein (CUT2 family) [Paenibacillus sp. BK033]